MVRAFTADPVDPSVVDDLVDLARRAPSAGNSQGMAYLVLEGADTAGYWDVSLPAAKRASFGWPGLVDAPVLILVLVRPPLSGERAPGRRLEAVLRGRLEDRLRLMQAVRT